MWLHFGGHVGGATKNLVERGIIPVPGPDAPNCDGGGRPYMRGAGPGVLSFDGRRWRQYLAGHCISDVAVTADGTVWVTDEGAEEEGDGIGLYVITPKGVAAAR